MTNVNDHSTPIGFEAFSRLIDLVCGTDSIYLDGKTKQKNAKSISKLKEIRPSNSQREHIPQPEFRTT